MNWLLSVFLLELLDNRELIVISITPGTGGRGARSSVALRVAAESDRSFFMHADFAFPDNLLEDGVGASHFALDCSLRLNPKFMRVTTSPLPMHVERYVKQNVQKKENVYESKSNFGTGRYNLYVCPSNRRGVSVDCY